jgi:hypothetical protein
LVEIVSVLVLTFSHLTFPAMQVDPSILYAHVLGCIFNYASLPDLHSLTSVSRSWQQAVFTKARGDLELKTTLGEPRPGLPSLLAVVRSRLRFHINVLHIDHPVNAVVLLVLHTHFSHLDSLVATLGDQVAPFDFPAQLSNLVLKLQFTAAGSLQHFTAAVSGLKKLILLRLNLGGCAAGIIGDLSFAFLEHVQCQGLSVLAIQGLSILDTAALQLCLPLSVCDVSFCGRAGLLDCVDKKRLSSLAVNVTNEEDAISLTTFLKLSMLNVSVGVSHADFLVRLPELVVLDLSFKGFPVEMDRVVNALRMCTHLTNLCLGGGQPLPCSSKHLADILPSMPRLRLLSLSACDDLDSLDFLAAGTLSTTLQRFILRSCGKIQAMEVYKVLTLKALTHFSPIDSFYPPLHDFARQYDMSSLLALMRQ